MLQHFGRHPLVETLAATGPAQAISAELATPLMQVALEDVPAALARFESHENGLAAAESAARLARDGPNEVAHEKPLPAWLQLWQCYRNPFNLLLTALAAVSYLTGDAKATIVIGAMVLLSTVVRFVQEGRSNRAAASLKAMVSNTATVLRPLSDSGLRLPAAEPSTATAASPPRVEVPLRELVRGDVVALSAGDMVPADCRVLASRDLFIAQAAMTGESLPVEKFADRHNDSAGPLEQPNLVFMGTNVVSGAATALVVATGDNTYFGTLANRVTATDAAPNAFQAGVNSVSWLLIRFAAVMVPVVLLINGFTKGDWLEAFLFALSVAVGLTPEMLPMIVASTLARGAVRLSRKKVIVKRLDA
ncbi:MAG: magnesium-translocating P-type ATPase, partial [Ramlibacter sp.]|nr:magnesium-translocating P-type ATPase [Ramlibacter sp.]